MMDKPLRSGFTTGTCAAVAARAAAVMLLTGKAPEVAEVMTPKGEPARLEIVYAAFEEGEFREAVCAVKKDAGDDPDVTDKVLVYARISYIEMTPERCYESERLKGLWLRGGDGVGVVTRPGLSCPVGMHAINPVPRRMIFEQVEEVISLYKESPPPYSRRTEEKESPPPYSPRLLIQIEIPEGIALAEKTFNPKLGILGGISVLGSSGIVEPMSEAALLETIRLEIHQRAVEGGKRILMAPGNYGMDFLGNRLGLPLSMAVKTSNFIGDAVLMAAEEGFEEVLFFGHLGKMIKAAGGMKNTHSKFGDKRMETLAAITKQWLIEQGKEAAGLIEGILKSNTTEEALCLLREKKMAEPVMRRVAERVREQMLLWCGNRVKIEVVTFSSVYDILGMTNEDYLREIIDEYHIT